MSYGDDFEDDKFQRTLDQESLDSDYRPYYLQATRLSDVSGLLAQGEQPLDKDRSIIAQSAGKDAVELVKVIFADGGPQEDVVSAYKAIKQAVFNDTLALAGAQSVVETFEGEPSTTQTAAPRSTSGAGSVEIRSGKHAGKTIAQVADEDPSYLEWASGNLKNDFLKSRIREFLAAA